MSDTNAGTNADNDRGRHADLTKRLAELKAIDYLLEFRKEALFELFKGHEKVLDHFLATMGVR